MSFQNILMRNLASQYSPEKAESAILFENIRIDIDYFQQFVNANNLVAKIISREFDCDRITVLGCFEVGIGVEFEILIFVDDEMISVDIGILENADKMKHVKSFNEEQLRISYSNVRISEYLKPTGKDILLRILAEGIVSIHDQVVDKMNEPIIKGRISQNRSEISHESQ
jgi:hypothetical protein